MNIGREIRTIIVTPVEEPVPHRETRPARRDRETPTPAKPRKLPARKPAQDPVTPTRTPRKTPAR